jgi:P-type Ca2+ transporter type 2C
VPGDLVVLDEGEAVPADLRLCEVSQLEIVEAILTGESVATQKSIRTIRKKVFFNVFINLFINWPLRHDVCH